jgi:hypothetical protein
MSISKMIVLAAAASITTAAFAEEPVQNVDQRRHGDLATAQTFIGKAYDSVTAAQTNNRYELGGHATNAKKLLRQAPEEIKLAAEAANGR